MSANCQTNVRKYFLSVLCEPEPTMTDIDKTYELMAEAEQEVIEAQLAAYGYIPVMQEDGTIIYIHEQTELLSYEE